MGYKTFLLLTFLLIVQSSIAQKIKFKDEILKSTLKELGYDFNKNTEIEVSEVDTVTILDVSEKNIKQLDDLIYFRSLKILYARDNEINNLNVFFNNNIIEEIYIGDNHLGKKLILKGLRNLKGLYAFRNDLEKIELVGTDNIQSLYLQGNQFEKVEFKNLLNLKSLQLSENKKLTDIDVSSNKRLIQLYLNFTAISKLDVTNNPLLKTLYVEKNVQVIKSDAQSKFKPMPNIKIE